MPDYLSVPHLLGQLDVDRQHEAIQLAERAEQILRAQRNGTVQDALQIANNAVAVAQDRVQLRGATLLYRSYLCLSMPERIECGEATRDCNRAIRDFACARHNHALALIIHALIDLEIDGEAGQSSALGYLVRAKEDLQTLIATPYEQSRLFSVAQYKELYDQVARNANAIIEDLTSNPVQEPSE
jgi:hypothetical protein